MKFTDIQVNGYAGVDFLSEPITSEQFELVARTLRAGDVEVILPTITTDAIDRMAMRLSNLRRLIDQDKASRKLMPAFHIEGPCISPVEGYRGAHPAEWIRPATPALLEPLIEAAGGFERVAMVTLAPEVDAGLKTTRWLIEHGALVAIGHTNASMAELRDAEQAGVSLFTHFGNGCSHMVDRHDNVLNRALALEKIKYSLIPDGHHLPWFLLKSWIRHLGVERCLFTTDCVSPAAAPPGRYRIHHMEVEVGPNKRVQPAGKPHLAGSALTMRDAYDNAIQQLGLSPAQAQAMCCDQPKALISRFLQ